MTRQRPENVAHVDREMSEQMGDTVWIERADAAEADGYLSEAKIARLFRDANTNLEEGQSR